MSPDSSLSVWRQRAQANACGLQAVLRFARSVFAECIVYILVLHAMTAVIAFYVILPVDLFLSAFREDYMCSQGLGVDLASVTIVPWNPFVLGRFPFLTRVALVVLAALTVRPSLVIAGWIVRRRLPAYTFCSGDFPPIRWMFEDFCFFADENLYLGPDLELYVRKALCALGAHVEAKSSTNLGTISRDEHDDLSKFDRIYHAVMDQHERSLSHGYTYTGLTYLPPPPVVLGQAARCACAHWVFSQSRYQSRMAQSTKKQGLPSHLEDEYTNTGSGQSQAVEDGVSGVALKYDCVDHTKLCRRFLVMYIQFSFYWLLRVCGEGLAACSPWAFDGGASSMEEWYNFYVPPLKDTAVLK